LSAVVLDAALALALVLPDESSGSAERLLRDLALGRAEVVTAQHWSVEIANGLLQACRRRRISPEDRLIACDFLLGLPVGAVANPSAADLFAVADRDRLSVYDACYLALALERKARVATADGPLRRAAQRHALLWSPSS